MKPGRMAHFLRESQPELNSGRETRVAVASVRTNHSRQTIEVGHVALASLQSSGRLRETVAHLFITLRACSAL